MIEYRILGPVEVLDDGESVDSAVKWRKNFALLAYLGRSAGKPKTRDHLTGLLWPEKPDTSARHSLREAFRVIRKVVGKDGLLVEGEHVRLADGVFCTDLDRFEALAGAGEMGPAWELVRGEFMEGFSVPDCSDYENWLAAERKTWRDAAVAVASGVVRDRMDGGDLEGALSVLDSAQSLAPDSEELGVLSMRARALSGDRAGAMRAFEALANALSEYGASPDNHTLELAERIRRGKERRIPSAPQVSEKDVRRTPLIGRATELASALREIEEATSSRMPAAVIVRGNPGSGKSRFVNEIVSRARLSGMTTATVMAIPSDSNEPWSGVFALARGGLLDAPGLVATDASALAVFAERLPEWRESFASVESPDISLSPGRALEEVMRAVTEDHPALLLVDDAGLLDRESLEAISGLVFRVRAPIVLLVALNLADSCDAVDALRSKLGGDVKGRAIELDALNERDLRELAGWALPDFSSEEIDRLSRRLLKDSAGLPVLAVELLNAVSLGLELERFEAAWPRPLETLEQTMPGDLPDAIVGAIRVGFRKLSDSAQLVVSIAAVAGGCTSFEQFSVASRLSDSILEGALDEAEWQRWLEVDSRGYSFVARIVREVVLADLVSSGQKRRILSALGPQG